ncbi:MAG: NAD-dependent epimerase/dehydratase family protein [Chloroflexi bacterium]|uniref:NAD-dependent epimerase/dehydratase family protein n=1 Tax=Candidatus Flexifilum breve TaxID=3140694 RepID=UPI00313707DF|nr:NAD-dependent epimerase/dehydratase family protein [Chloroflexota bacterium]
MHVLVIGGAGMLGRALARLLHQAGHRVTSFDLLPCPESGVTSLSGDVRDAEALLAACAGMDAVIHTVAYVNQLPTRQPLMYDINVLGVQQTIDACRANHVPRLIYTGSIDAVFDGTPIRAGDETLPYPAQHLDYYSETKMLGEQERSPPTASSSPPVRCAWRGCMANTTSTVSRMSFPGRPLGALYTHRRRARALQSRLYRQCGLCVCAGCRPIARGQRARRAVLLHHRPRAG